MLWVGIVFVACPDPTFHFDADPDPNPDPLKLKKIVLLFTAMLVYIV
jgi:hypothetical protein